MSLKPRPAQQSAEFLVDELLGVTHNSLSAMVSTVRLIHGSAEPKARALQHVQQVVVALATGQWDTARAELDAAIEGLGGTAHHPWKAQG